MFRTLIYPSSGACDYSVELPHWSYCSWFDVCWSFGLVGLEWYPCCRLKPATLQHKLLMTDILMSETCWAHKKWNKITNDIKLVFYSSTRVSVVSNKITFVHLPVLFQVAWEKLLISSCESCGIYFWISKKELSRILSVWTSVTFWWTKEANSCIRNPDQEDRLFCPHCYGAGTQQGY